MGLDHVELILEVEDTFGVKIPDADYENLVTVGDLHRYLLRRFEKAVQRAGASSPCASMAMFLETRRALVNVTEVDRQAVRPKKSLYELIPYLMRRKAWDSLQKSLQVQLPKLLISQSDLVSVVGGTVALLGLTVIALTLAVPPAGGLLVIPLGVAVLVIVLAVIEILKTEFPPECSTVADLVKFALKQSTDWVRKSDVPTDENAVWEKLVEIISSQLQIPRDEVTPTARFIDDLGMG